MNRYQRRDKARSRESYARARAERPRRGPSASNAVVNAVLEAAALYRVPAFRMQSRAYEVVGEGGRNRLMFTGEWSDDTGLKHHGGMADVLLTPTILLPGAIPRRPHCVPVPLWCEAKSGTGKLTEHQEQFRDYVLRTGGYYIVCYDSADELLTWFCEHEVGE